MTEIVVNIMVELFFILASAVKQMRSTSESPLLLYHLTKCGADGIGHGYVAGKGVEAVLKRLDRFIENEARSTAAQTLQVVYGLVQNVKILVDGKQMPFALTF